MKKIRETIRKYKIVFAALLGVLVVLLIFFAVHQAVYNIRQEKAEQEMNEQLEGKVFISYKYINSEKNRMIVKYIQEKGVYTERNYEVKKNENTAQFEYEVNDKKLEYGYSYWGDITAVDDRALELDANGNVVRFGSQLGYDSCTIATEEELSLIKTADERELTKHRLSDFMMSFEEYKQAYVRSGMPVTKKLLDYGTKDFCVFYKNDYDNTFFFAKDDFDPGHFEMVANSKKGMVYGYEYMLNPMLLYLEGIPGAITDIDELIKQWDEEMEPERFSDAINAEFTYNGITYHRITSSNSDAMVIVITVDKTHDVYLADYPEFMAQSNHQSHNDTNDNGDAFDSENDVQALDCKRAWKMQTQFDGREYSMTFALNEDKTFSSVLTFGDYEPDGYYHGTYAMTGNQVSFTFSDETIGTVAYEYDSVQSTFTQLSDHGIFQTHKKGDVFPVIAEGEDTAENIREMCQQ